MTRLTAALLAALLVPAAATAGDPCPIKFHFYALLDGLKSKDSWVGISFGNAKGGVIVKAVSSKSPAEKSGLKVGDLIVNAGGKAMTSHKELGSLFRDTKPGGTVKLQVKRGDKTVDLTLVLSRQDPVVGALIDYAHRNECSEVRRGEVAEDKMAAVRQAMVRKGKLRCRDAHKALAKGDFGLEDGDIVILRDGKKILISNTAWASTCVDARWTGRTSTASPSVSSTRR
jgi:membrane-associated protease RseP (regulator of RpoE activity)